jgi:hypothetical protein
MDDVPFDLRHMRCILYRPDPAGLRKLEHDLVRALHSDAGDVFRFVVSDNGTYNFNERLSGRGRNFYTFRIAEIWVGRTDLKLSILVQRQSLDQGPADFGPSHHYLQVGEAEDIQQTNWALRVDRVENGRAFFSVLPRSAMVTKACRRPPIASARSSLRLSMAPDAQRYAARVDGIRLVGDGGRRGMDGQVGVSGSGEVKAFVRSVCKGADLARREPHNNSPEPTALSRCKLVVLWFGSWSCSGERRPGSCLTPWPSHFLRSLHSHRASGGNVAPELVDATPSGSLLGHGTAIGSHSAAHGRRPASLETAISQVAALLWYQCFGHDVSLLHDCVLSSTIRVLN